MAIVIAPGAEPIPGYRLLHRLGSGGFGEVWKVQAPGGFFKAIKFVFGNLHDDQDGGSQGALKELNALQRVQGVRHPYILSLERYDIIDGQLMIVMELADRSLRDRFGECLKRGLPGIPRDELLRYLEETAEALDLMNIQHGLQHLDIKPGNLFLVHHHVKIADFGLVKGLEGLRTDEETGVTCEYAGPERWLGGMSRYCDQYSMAIVYQELLTGTLPFGGKDPEQWRWQHLRVPPNVVPLPEGDRDAIMRALSKRPKDRFPSCLELVQALKRNRVETPAPAAGRATNLPPDKITVVSCEVACPACGRRGKVPVTFQGRTVKCPGCQQGFVVPELAPVDIPDELRLTPVGEEPVRPAILEPEFLVDAKCPHCGHAGHVPEKLIGRKLKCRKCGTVFLVEPPP